MTTPVPTSVHVVPSLNCRVAIRPGADVERINQFDFYNLSRKLQKLVALEGQVSAKAAVMPVWHAQVAMDELLAGRPIELGVSRSMAEALKSQLDYIIQRYFTEETPDGVNSWRYPSDDTSPINAWEWNWVRTAVSNFEMIFAEEMREAATYRVPNRGIYNTTKLVDAADCTFPTEVLPVVPQKTREEWREAGRCMAFGMFTACGFHVARAVEGTLESYFKLFDGSSSRKLRQWGDYLDALEKVQADLMPHSKTLGELRQMKDDWRNPLMHPRVALGESDARAVFNNGETLIMLMAQEISAAQKAGAQKALAVIQGGAA